MWQDAEEFMNHLQSKGRLSLSGLYKGQNRIRNSDDKLMSQYDSTQCVSLRIFKYTALKKKAFKKTRVPVNVVLFAFL